MFGDFEIGSTGNWQKDLEKLASLKREIDTVSQEVPAMSAYLQRRYQQKVEKMAPGIKAGLVQEHRAAVAAYQRAEDRSRAAQAKELARWNPQQYAMSRAIVMERIESIRKSSSNFALTGGPDKVEKLKSLQAELMASGDIHIQRAAAEIFEGEIQDMPWSGDAKNGKPIMYQLGELVVGAREALPGLRTIPEQQAALVELGAAYDDLADKQQQLFEIGRQLGDNPTGPFHGGSDLDKAYRTVQFFEDGTVKINAPDSVEVSGVDMRKLKLEVTP